MVAIKSHKTKEYMSHFGIFQEHKVVSIFENRTMQFLTTLTEQKRKVCYPKRYLFWLCFATLSRTLVFALSNTLFCPCSLGQELRKDLARWFFKSFDFSEGGGGWKISYRDAITPHRSDAWVPFVLSVQFISISRASPWGWT